MVRIIGRYSRHDEHGSGERLVPLDLYRRHRRCFHRLSVFLGQKEQAIRPGHKVKTAGGICGIVVEVCDDNTVIIETGSENSGKSYVKMDKELIAQTDAKGPTQIAREEAEAKRKAEKEAKEAAKRGEGAPAAEAPAQEQPAQEEAPASEEENKEEK